MNRERKLQIKHFVLLKLVELLPIAGIMLALIVPPWVASQFFGLEFGCGFGKLSRSYCTDLFPTWIIEVIVFDVVFWLVTLFGLSIIYKLYEWLLGNWQEARRLAKKEIKEEKNK